MGRDDDHTSTYVEIDGREYLLGHDQDRGDVMSRIAEAARSEPAFVDLSDGGRRVSVLVSHQSRVVITVRHDSAVHAEHDPLDASIADWDL
ncbi:hypothetical protein [Microbacterium aerolatum]|uniref:Uncharacterized protein n=1 Tax=Microbacterium aerolatum TaxID=153731 RepID=A0A511AGG9_9MICO|nr:hypothetical protein [Microbacterium aerolatum]GEK87248.1 hypothetical protein MAE01_24240 [Microbacterium aerolatum]GGB35429.1 hypothetical protein GCM10007198_27410 [Microbacterium aerolatum]